MYSKTKIAHVERTTGLLYAGTVRAAGMDVPVFTKDGNPPLWSGATDPADIEAVVVAEKQARQVASIPTYSLTKRGKDALAGRDKSSTNKTYNRMMDVMQAILDDNIRQIDITSKLGIPQQKVWYAIQKLIVSGLINIHGGKDAIGL